MKTYSSTEIQNIVGITRGQLNHWINQGLIEPFEDVCGRGKSRVLNDNNLLETLLCKILTEGVSGVKTWAGALRLIRNEDFKKYAFLVWDQISWRLIKQGELINTVGQKPILVFRLKSLIDEFNSIRNPA